MKEETLSPSEIIFQDGDESLNIYFITKGNVIICDGETQIIYKELIVMFINYID